MICMLCRLIAQQALLALYQLGFAEQAVYTLPKIGNAKLQLKRVCVVNVLSAGELLTRFPLRNLFIGDAIFIVITITLVKII